MANGTPREGQVDLAESTESQAACCWLRYMPATMHLITLELEWADMHSLVQQSEYIVESELRKRNLQTLKLCYDN
eukprot:scaffold82940_cov19-Prasinocladus_malaysianus.AAC.1